MLFPDDIWQYIKGYVNDLYMVSEHKKIMMRAMNEMLEDKSQELWTNIEYLFDEYYQYYEEWRLNDIYFDPIRTEEIVNEMYCRYDENKELLLRVYRRYKNINTCSYCRQKRLDINMMSHVPYSAKYLYNKEWKYYEIIEHNSSCYQCLQICSKFYDLEFKNLWKRSW
jgi:hypothetical protein